MQGTIDFFAVIREDSKYSNQSSSAPFPVRLDHSPDGYLWVGNGNRYRPVDLWLLWPANDPTRVEDDPRIPVTFDLAPADDDEAEAEYQSELADADWFRVLPNQAVDQPAFEYVDRSGRRLP